MTQINKTTGYKVVLVEPLCTLGTKNFDLMLYNEINQIAILIEAKSSVSERGKGNTIARALKSTKKMKFLVWSLKSPTAGETMKNSKTITWRNDVEQKPTLQRLKSSKGKKVSRTDSFRS
jgi:hypothetical protein